MEREAGARCTARRTAASFGPSSVVRRASVGHVRRRPITHRVASSGLGRVGGPPTRREVSRRASRCWRCWPPVGPAAAATARRACRRGTRRPCRAAGGLRAASPGEQGGGGGGAVSQSRRQPRGPSRCVRGGRLVPCRRLAAPRRDTKRGNRPASPPARRSAAAARPTETKRTSVVRSAGPAATHRAETRAPVSQSPHHQHTCRRRAARARATPEARFG